MDFDAVSHSASVFLVSNLRRELGCVLQSPSSHYCVLAVRFRFGSLGGQSPQLCSSVLRLRQPASCCSNSRQTPADAMYSFSCLSPWPPVSCNSVVDPPTTN